MLLTYPEAGLARNSAAVAKSSAKPLNSRCAGPTEPVPAHRLGFFSGGVTAVRRGLGADGDEAPAAALEIAAYPKNNHVADWVNPRGGHGPRPQFRPDTFLAGGGTLYSLSKEGAGTTTASMNRGVRSTSTALKRERILGVDDLAALPCSPAVLLTAGSRAASCIPSPLPRRNDDDSPHRGLARGLQRPPRPRRRLRAPDLERCRRRLRPSLCPRCAGFHRMSEDEDPWRA